MFAYCGNNPVMGYDPVGMWDWRTFWDFTVTGAAAISGAFTAAKTTVKARIKGSSKTSARIKGVSAGVTTFGVVNNAVNAFYYNNISDGESSLETTSEDKSDYVNGYINRWDRLDYTKQQTGDAEYGFNAWRYNSEYSMHMYGWYAISPFCGLGNEKIDAYGESAIQVHIEPQAEDTNWKTRVVTYFFGILGL